MASTLLRNSINGLINLPRKSPFSGHRNLTANSQQNPLPSTEFNFAEYRATKVNQINKALDEAVVPSQNTPPILHEAMRYTLQAGGKRFAPTLCIASCELVGGNESLAMPMACALEMMVASAVILDDLPCTDNDDLRRGKPANHKVFGEGISVLASQALSFLAIEHFETKTKGEISSDRLVRAVVELCSALGSKGAVAGQVADINSEGKEVSLSELEFIHRNKTGKIVETSVVCGVLVGGGNDVEIEMIRKYGKCMGLAYQVWDDILDETGNTEELGKKAGKDLVRNKATYPKLMGVDESKKYARELVVEAKEELSYFDSTMAAPLYHIANFVVSRSH
uniref:Geranylgeranyl pyrophosphate synthase, chloroplastic n=1 Tax=Pistacia terebinthus subsp. palaestina TaxID=434239 RepID=A0A8F2ZG79_9ROSI|nr:geranylgeranyl pyrophosphate synthase, chloroplastic [Pistacia terebinthus subsp. palaestina]